MALGAGKAHVLWTVSKESVLTALAGLLGGLGALAALQTWLTKVVFDYYVQQLAPGVVSAPVLGVATAVVVVTVFMAVAATAHGATRVDPVEVLRSE
jgi:ABC-type antimicrobial peptide transport system permease subunit